MVRIIENIKNINDSRQVFTIVDIQDQLACEQALSCRVGEWREEERELAIMSHKFDFLRPKSGREMLIG